MDDYIWPAILILFFAGLIIGIVMMAKWTYTKPKPSDVYWRWVFLVALTVNSTIWITLSIQDSRGYRIDYDRYPNWTRFIEVSMLSTALFLFYVSPYFFRRLGGLAALAWIEGVLAIVFGVLTSGT